MATRVALLGTGLMGFPMSVNLLKGGFDLAVWNRTRSKAEPLGEQGARVADSAADAAKGADVVITMLESGPIVRDVVFDSGVADAMAAGSTLIDMSSIPPKMAQEHAERLAQAGVNHLDAPVSGGVPGAEKGTLAIMVGGDASVFAQTEPVFAPMGRATLVGPAGAGQLAKLANQTIVAVTITAVAEGLLLAGVGGADPKGVQAALSGGFADSIILQNHGTRMIDRNFVPGGRSKVQLKDLDTIVETARDLGLELPTVELVRNLFAALVEHGDGDVDHSGVLLEEERINTPKRLNDKPDKRP